MGAKVETHRAACKACGAPWQDLLDVTRIYRAALVIIGDEILSGRTQDANLAYLAKWLNSHGIRLAEARVVPDIEDEIVAAVNACRAKYDYCFTTGGIGPTHDDITAASIAKAFGVPLVEHPVAAKMLRDYYGDKINERRLRMALAPEGTELIYNKVSLAPGFRIGNVYILAGIPAVARSMLDALSGKLAGGQPVVSRTVSAWAMESVVAPVLDALQGENPDVAIGSYPVYRDGRAGANFVMRGTDQARVDRVAMDLVARLEEMNIPIAETEL